jgi:hypothetical protein
MTMTMTMTMTKDEHEATPSDSLDKGGTAPQPPPESAKPHGAKQKNGEEVEDSPNLHSHSNHQINDDGDGDDGNDETCQKERTSPPPPFTRPVLIRQTGHAQSVFETSHFQVPTNEEELWHAKAKYGNTNWRVHILEFLERKTIEYGMLALLLADIIILFAELYVQAEYPSCLVIERDAISCCSSSTTTTATIDNGQEGHPDRWLGGGSFCEPGSVESDIAAGCDPHKYDAIHALHNILFASSMIILSIFLLELILMIICLGPDTFFRQCFYTLDFFVVTTSWGLELSFRIVPTEKLASIAGILIIARLWRFIRIGHGIVEATVEMASKKHDKLLEYIERLENILEAHELDLPETDRTILKRLKGLDSTVMDSAGKGRGGRGGQERDDNDSLVFAIA